jgi:5-methylcytosine-specific restriction endonuclease McrA
MKICSRCNQARPDAHAKEHRAILCDPCRLAAERERNARRPWYGGSWPAIRRTVKRTQWCCQKCGSTEGLEVDHVAARSLGRGVQLLCASCHRAKGNGRT